MRSATLEPSARDATRASSLLRKATIASFCRKQRAHDCIATAGNTILGLFLAGPCAITPQTPLFCAFPPTASADAAPRVVNPRPFSGFIHDWPCLVIPKISVPFFPAGADAGPRAVSLRRAVETQGATPPRSRGRERLAALWACAEHAMARKGAGDRARSRLSGST